MDSIILVFIRQDKPDDQDYFFVFINSRKKLMKHPREMDFIFHWASNPPSVKNGLRSHRSHPRCFLYGGGTFNYFFVAQFF